MKSTGRMIAMMINVKTVSTYVKPDCEVTILLQADTYGECNRIFLSLLKWMSTRPSPPTQEGDPTHASPKYGDETPAWSYLDYEPSLPGVQSLVWKQGWLAHVPFCFVRFPLHTHEISLLTH